MDEMFYYFPTYLIPVLIPGREYTFSTALFKPIVRTFRGYEVRKGFDEIYPEKVCIIASLENEEGEIEKIDAEDLANKVLITKDGINVNYEISEIVFGLDKFQRHSQPVCFGVLGTRYADENGEVIGFNKMELK